MTLFTIIVELSFDDHFVSFLLPMYNRHRYRYVIRFNESNSYNPVNVFNNTVIYHVNLFFTNNIVDYLIYFIAYCYLFYSFNMLTSHEVKIYIRWASVPIVGCGWVGYRYHYTNIQLIIVQIVDIIIHLFYRYIMLINNLYSFSIVNISNDNWSNFRFWADYDDVRLFYYRKNVLVFVSIIPFVAVKMLYSLTLGKVFFFCWV